MVQIGGGQNSSHAISCILTDDERFSRFSYFDARAISMIFGAKNVWHIFMIFFDQEGIKLGLDALLFLKFDKSLKLEAPGNGTSKMISFFSKSLNFHQVNFSYFVTQFTGKRHCISSKSFAKNHNFLFFFLYLLEFFAIFFLRGGYFEKSLATFFSTSFCLTAAFLLVWSVEMREQIRYHF